MVPFGRGPVDVLAGLVFGLRTQFFGRRPGNVSRHEAVAAEKQSQTQISLPERNIAEAPFLEGCEIAIRPLMVPLRTPSILFHESGVLGHGRDNLGRATAIANDREALSPVVKLVVPSCGVEELAVEGLHARELGFAWLGDASHGRNEDGRSSGVFVLRFSVS